MTIIFCHFSNFYFFFKFHFWLSHLRKWREERRQCIWLGQESRETTAFGELKPEWILRATILHRTNNNTGERVTEADIFSVAKLECFYSANSSHGSLFLLSINREYACTENCLQTTLCIVCFILSIFFHIYPVKCPNQTVFTCIPKQATTVASYISSLWSHYLWFSEFCLAYSLTFSI